MPVSVSYTMYTTAYRHTNTMYGKRDDVIFQNNRVHILKEGKVSEKVTRYCFFNVYFHSLRQFVWRVRLRFDKSNTIYVGLYT